METVKAYFSNSMVEALTEAEVNIVSVQDADEVEQKLVEISIQNSAELYRIFSAGFKWGEKVRAKVGS